MSCVKTVQQLQMENYVFHSPHVSTRSQSKSASLFVCTRNELFNSIILVFYMWVDVNLNLNYHRVLASDENVKYLEEFVVI